MTANERELSSLRETLAASSRELDELRAAKQRLEQTLAEAEARAAAAANDIEAAREQMAGLETELKEEREHAESLGELANERREHMTKLQEQVEEAEERYAEANWKLGKSLYFERIVKRRKGLVVKLLEALRAKMKANTALKAGLDGLRTFKATAEMNQHKLLQRIDSLKADLKEAEETVKRHQGGTAAKEELTNAISRAAALEERLNTQAELIQIARGRSRRRRAFRTRPATTSIRRSSASTKELETKNQLIAQLQADTDEQQRKLAKLRGSESRDRAPEGADGEGPQRDRRAAARGHAAPRGVGAPERRRHAAASGNNAELEAKLKEREQLRDAAHGHDQRARNHDQEAHRVGRLVEAQVSVPGVGLTRTPTRAPPRNSRGDERMSSLTGSFDPVGLFADARRRPRHARRRLSDAARDGRADDRGVRRGAHLLVISPNRGSRDYGIYVSLTLATLLIAIVLENESLPAGTATLHYVVVPQLAAAARPAPVDLAPAGAVARRARRRRSRRRRSSSARCSGSATSLLGSAYWITLLVLAALLVFLWRKAVSTQRAFMKASSIYIGSKETLDARDGAAETLARLAAVGRADRRKRRARRRELAAARPRTRGDSRRRSRRRVRSAARSSRRSSAPCPRSATGSRARRGCRSSRASSGSPGSSSASR